MCGVLYLFAVLAIVILAWNQGWPWFAALVGVALLTWQARRQFLNRIRIQALRVVTEGVELRYMQNAEQVSETVVGLAGAIIWSRVVFIHWQSMSGKAQACAVWSDMLGEDDFRQLKVWLNTQGIRKEPTQR